MRALIKPSAAPGLELAEVPQPSPGHGEVLIRVLKAGLCGTDLHILSWDDFAKAHVRPGQIIGHEFYGEVVEVGPGVAQGGIDTIRVGDRVSVEGHVVCGRCRNCRAGRRHMCVRTSSIGVDRDGAFADYVVVPATNIWIQPDVIDPELGAIFDPFGNAVHTALQFPLTGEDVLVTGAGPIGIMAALLARHGGAHHVVISDPNQDRLELARTAFTEVGTVVAVTPDQVSAAVSELGIREGFDVGLEMSGHPTATVSMIDECTHGAKIAMLGLPAGPYAIDWNQVISRMLTIKGVYGREMYDTWYKATFILQSSATMRDAMRSIITHRYTPDTWAEAFEAAASGTAGKVIIDWS